MQIAHFQNPFYEFIKSCNESWIDIDNIPRTSKDHILGTCTFFDAYWKQLDNLSTYVPTCLLYTSPSPRDATLSRMPSSA